MIRSLRDIGQGFARALARERTREKANAALFAQTPAAPESRQVFRARMRAKAKQYAARYGRHKNTPLTQRSPGWRFFFAVLRRQPSASREFCFSGDQS